MTDGKKLLNKVDGLEASVESSDAAIDTPLGDYPGESILTKKHHQGSRDGVSQRDQLDMQTSSQAGQQSTEGNSNRTNYTTIHDKITELGRHMRAVAQRELALEGRASKLDARERQIEREQRALHKKTRAQRAREEKLTQDKQIPKNSASDEKQLEKELRSLKRREGKLRVEEQSLEKKRKSQRKLRADFRQAQSTIDALNSELRSRKRKISKLTKQAASNAMQISQIEKVTSAFAWLLENGSNEYPALWSEAVVIGSGPFDEDDIARFLADRGIELYEPHAMEVQVMIVGSENWSDEKLEMQIAAQQGGTLKVYSQEMALLALAAGNDMFDMDDEDTLERLGGDHPALAFLRESELQWPSTSVPSLPQEYTPFEFEDRGADKSSRKELRFPVDRSPLKEMGYTVGITAGLPATARKELLTTAYMNELPFVHSTEYMNEWGRAKSRRRLWRIAHHLAWLANAWSAMPTHGHAVCDWKSDLAMLEKKLYKSWMGFVWPKVRARGRRGKG